nr:uncharacterized serine-rich protein C1E8.05-like [Tanacetum cinerariifolium]
DLEQTTRGRGDEPNRILLVTIHHMIYPITMEVLNQILSPHGYVEKVVISQKSAHVQALIQFQSRQNAIVARNSLQEAGNNKSTLFTDTFGNSGADESETSGPETPVKEVVDNGNGSALFFFVGYDTGSKAVTGLPEEFQEGDVVDALLRVLEQTSSEKWVDSGGSDQHAEYALSKLLQMGKVAEYESEFVILVNRVTGISANLLKSFYIFGLKPGLQRKLFRSRPTTLGEAISFARIAEAHFEDERSPIVIAKPNKLTANVHVQDLEQTTRGRVDEPNRILLVTIHHMIYPINMEVLNQIISPRGENCFSILNAEEAGNTKSTLFADTFGNSGVDELEPSGPETPTKEVVDNGNGSALIFWLDTKPKVRLVRKSGLIAVAEDETTHFLEPHYSPSSILVSVILLVEEYGIPESIPLEDKTLRASTKATFDMGACMSSAGDSIHKSTNYAFVVSTKGELRQFPTPIFVSEVLQYEKPSFFVCNSDNLYQDQDIPSLNSEDELHAGQIYFILPKTMLARRLSASDMASLAVKASLALDSNTRISPMALMETSQINVVVKEEENKHNYKNGGLRVSKSRSTRSWKARLAARSFRHKLSTIYEDN